MIIIYHENNKTVEVEYNGVKVDFSRGKISETLFEIAILFPDEFLIWCQIGLKSNLNVSALNGIFHHRKIMASYNLRENSFLSDAIGYIDSSSFIKINKKVSYPTWQMSGNVGGIHASVLVALKDEVAKTKDFDYFLNSIAKLTMLNGLLCYSEPKLVKKITNKMGSNTNSLFVLFRFVKQHYKMRWVFLLFLNFLLYEKRLTILPFLNSFFYSEKKMKIHLLDKIQVQSTNKVVESGTMDVIIPTIGRKAYLYDVLKDLAVQTYLPSNVIIIEQNPNPESVSELDYLATEKWPFTIKHTFTHQAGACNARNLALKQVQSEWVFLNDDDNRFDQHLIENVFKKSIQYGINAITTVSLQPNQVQYFNRIHQSGIFGSGCSFVKTSALSQICFDMSLEFGYGEDTDFGCQLRNVGNDIIFFPDLKITHLKAPMGGFRIKTRKQWEEDEIQPKPSPTIIYLKRKHFTQEQIKGYKLVYFIKSIKNKSFLRWYSFYKMFQKGWELSVLWSEKI